jgi:hypothetical protein
VSSAVAVSGSFRLGTSYATTNVAPYSTVGGSVQCVASLVTDVSVGGSVIGDWLVGNFGGALLVSQVPRNNGAR